VKSQEELITPKLAEKYLNANTRNRPLRAGHAERMVADMAAGAWTACAAPIVFYTDATLADGQHRLWAITMSGVAQTFTVIRDFPIPAGVNIDTGVPRNAVDAARINGIDADVNALMISTARGVEDGQPMPGRRARSVTETLTVLSKHKEMAHWVSKHGPKGRGIRNSAVLSAIGRAWYVELDKNRLAHFGRVLSKGFVESEIDSAAVALRNYLLMKMGAKAHTASSGMWRDTFLKVQNAIYAFMRGTPLTIIKTTADESYPLADKVDPAAAKTKRGAHRASQARKAAKKKR
jgi:hypothetical protein